MFKYIFLATFFIFTGCETYNTVDSSPSIKGDIEDNASWYDDMQNHVLDMRVAIPTPNDFNCTDFNDTNGTLRPCTFTDVNNDIDAYDDYEPMLRVNLQMNDFNSSIDLMNASFEQKGKSTRESEYKSYRIKLDSEENIYRGERTFQLNKHPYDNSKVRNKLAFDLFREIPHMTSLKTEFVYLDINSTENNISDVNSSNFGLFTHVEKVGKEFLINRGWNEDDKLYKAQDFDFSSYDELVLDEEGEPVDPEAFDKVLEIERGENHKNLSNMLKAINDPSSNFELVFEKYFNRNNYITWLAVNIILANKDTVTQNFYLLNPINSDTFYFLPWDYDNTDQFVKWELGIGMWWAVPLHNRFLRIEQNRIDLDNMVKSIREMYITSEVLQSKIDTYEALIAPYLLRSPQIDDFEFREWQRDIKTLENEININLKNYESQVGHPMPFWQEVSYEEGSLALGWERSIDLEGDSVIYELKVSQTPDMNDSIIDELVEDIPSIDENNINISKNITLDNGIYYMRVISKEKDNPEHYQIAFDNEVEVNDIRYPGVLEFEVK